jgi:hypothetical protein
VYPSYEGLVVAQWLALVCARCKVLRWSPALWVLSCMSVVCILVYIAHSIYISCIVYCISCVLCTDKHMLYSIYIYRVYYIMSYGIYVVYAG